MWRYLIASHLWWTLVQGKCGVCPINHLTSHQDRLQARAYNDMPKNFRAISMKKDVRTFARVRHHYGPWSCIKECHIDRHYSPHPTCRVKVKTPHQILLEIGYCLNKYHDAMNRVCIQPPQWSNTWGMWCKTHYQGHLWNWNYTHFPICAATNRMCIPPHMRNLKKWTYAK